MNIQDYLFRKSFAVAVIVLFIGLGFAPVINVVISKGSIESEMVDFTTEICGLNGGKFTISLTKEEAGDVEDLIDNIKRRLDEVNTREETVEIFNEAVVELDKFGLLGGLNVKQAQKLVTGNLQNSNAIKVIQKICSKNQLDYGNKNVLCLIAGDTSGTFFEGAGARFFERIAVFFNGFDILFILSVFMWLFFLGISDVLNPIPIFYTIGFGYLNPETVYLESAHGWVYSIGLMGKKIWEGSLYGDLSLSTMYVADRFGFYISFPGVVGFTGIRLLLYGAVPEREHFYLGCGIGVRIGYKPPYY